MTHFITAPRSRLFRPWAPTGGDTPGQPTDPGPEHDPTPIPATRRIVRPRMLLARTPPVPTPVRLPAEPDARAISGVIPDPTAADPGPPTVRLTRPPEPLASEPSSPVRPARRWWAVIFRLASILLRRRKPGRETDVKSSPDRTGG